VVVLVALHLLLLLVTPTLTIRKRMTRSQLRSKRRKRPKRLLPSLLLKQLPRLKAAVFRLGLIAQGPSPTRLLTAHKLGKSTD
jgi:hypothetical protein